MENHANVLLIGPSSDQATSGLEAEQRVLAAHQCHAVTATTAMLTRNDDDSLDTIETPPAFLNKRIGISLKDAAVDVVKIDDSVGLKESTVEYLAAILKNNPKILSLLDCNEKSSAPLFAHLTVLCTTKADALDLLGLNSTTEGVNVDQSEVAKSLKSLGSKYVVIKPLFQATEEPFTVTVYGDDGLLTLKGDLSTSRLPAGLDSAFVAAISANIAKNLAMPKAVEAALRYIEACARDQPVQLNYFHSVYKLPFTPGNFVDYLLARDDVQEAWKRHTEHEFLTRLANGTLPLEAFKYYLIQDYLFLVQFARANSLAAYKEKDLDKIVRSAEIVLHINREMALHLSYCKDFGLTKEDILKTEESQACTAYTRYVLDTGASEDWLALQIALSPCLIGYGVIARRLYDDPKTVREGNPYWKWIANYVADDYTEAVTLGIELLDKHAQKQSPSRIEELVKIFIHATNMETGFWNMGYAKIGV
ncbi:hypothetical protein BP6252_02779 [Coleophoma cylindrospora]|uniref:Thiaminase-2/PQQC domain-containing protein n=1 Tax=Coleophoma cylindrospora TaxID=1849047 RepID=A0A3D8SFR9_9HELO|nr:hypothetical protein BP6252_02779 [Coleophoma cylindrospora]